MPLRASAFPADSAAHRKARGAFFTPETIARFVVDWAIRGASDRVLEPSCGDAAFLVPAAQRLSALQGAANHSGAPRVDGIDIHAPSAAEAERRVREAGGDPQIEVSDFFLVDPRPEYTAVIGNPPFVRYQEFRGEARARSRAAALRAGVNMSGLASSWAAFTIHAALMLKSGGRLGLVLPAELLSVNYASEVRRFLLENFSRVDLVLFSERVFPEVQEEVVLLLADGFGEGSTTFASIYQSQNAAGLTEVLAPTTWSPTDPGDKWTASLLAPQALTTFSALNRTGAFVGLETWGDTTLGIVTGNNRYFALSPDHAAELGVGDDELLKLSPPGSSHLRGLALTSAALTSLGRGGAQTKLFRPAGEPSAAAVQYIAAGEATSVHEAYKCRVRKPWWRVPSIKPADLFLTYMNADTARLTTNEASALHLNSVHGVYLQERHRTLGRQLLPLASLTSMTLVGAETVGRAYGGGMLKVEPREADQLPVPSPEVVLAAADDLTRVKPVVARLLSYGRLVEASALVDDVLLVGQLGLGSTEVASLRDAYRDLAARRKARGQRVEG